MANRRRLLAAIDTVERGEPAPGVADPGTDPADFTGPDTVDGIAPADQWEHWWQTAVRTKREGAPWLEQPVAAK